MSNQSSAAAPNLAASSGVEAGVHRFSLHALSGRTWLPALPAGIATYWMFQIWLEGGRISPWDLFLQSVALGLILGFVMLYGAGGILCMIGALLRGKADYAQTRTAVAWSAVPIAGALLLPFLLAAGALLSYIVNERSIPQTGNLFSTALFNGPASPLIDLSYLAFALLLLASFVMLVQAMAQVNQFSIYRALITVLLTPPAGFVFLLLTLLGFV